MKTADSHLRCLGVCRCYSQKDPGSLSKSLISTTCWSLYACFHCPSANLLLPSTFQILCRHLSLVTSNPKPYRQAEDEMAGWHCQLNGHEFEQTLGDGEGEGSLVCYSPWGHKESATEQQQQLLYRLEESLGLSPEILEGSITYGSISVSSQRLKNKPEDDLRCPSTAHGC